MLALRFEGLRPLTVTPLSAAETHGLGARPQARPRRVHAWAASRNRVTVRGGSPAVWAGVSGLRPWCAAQVPTGGASFS